jgi:hypothetical protein
MLPRLVDNSTYLISRFLLFVDLLVALIREPARGSIRNTIGLFIGTVIGRVCRLCICLLFCVVIPRQLLFPNKQVAEEAVTRKYSSIDKFMRVERITQNMVVTLL